MFHSMRRLGLVAASIAAGLTLFAGASQALTISFTAQAFDPIVINTPSGINSFYVNSGGIPTGLPNVSALLVNYNTSGLPYYVSKVVFNTSTASPSVFMADAGSGTPVTLASIAGGNASASPAAGATIGGGGTTLTQTYADGEFQQGAISGEFSYVQINNGGTTVTGWDHTAGTGDNTSAPNAADLSAFNGTTIAVTFTFRPGDVDHPLPCFNLGTEFTLSSAYAVQTTGQAADLGFRNTALAGNTVECAEVPEPGTLALFIGMGISGSGLLLRRRRR